MGGCYGLSKMFLSIVDIMSEESQNSLNLYFIEFLLETSGRSNRTLRWASFGLQALLWAALVQNILVDIRVFEGECP